MLTRCQPLKGVLIFIVGPLSIFIAPVQAGECSDEDFGVLGFVISRQTFALRGQNLL
jgi:hypothetical protein